jgi:carboxypeptidase C (cathepsin A)
MEEVTAEFITFMNNLYIMYPEFSGKRLYIAGESYAGKYIPAFSVALHEAGYDL